MHMRESRGLGDFFERYFGCAVVTQQTVGLLESVGELRITKTAEQREPRYHLHEFLVEPGEFLFGGGRRIRSA